MDKELEIRGHKFASNGNNIPLAELTKLYLVFRALEGDDLAIELLDKSGTIVHDKSGVQLWPVITKE